MRAIIPAAGFATRLGDMVKDRPKHLLEIAGKPIIDYVVSGIEGIDEIEEVYLVTNEKFYGQFQEWNKPRME